MTTNQSPIEQLIAQYALNTLHGDAQLERIKLVKAIEALLLEAENKGRIEELNCIPLTFGRLNTITYINGKAETIENRIAELTKGTHEL